MVLIVVVVELKSAQHLSEKGRWLRKNRNIIAAFPNLHWAGVR